MPKVRKDISNKEVLDLYEYFGKNKSKVARYLDCSLRLVFEVVMGVRRDPTLPRQKIKKSKELCTCCGINPKGKGKRFLCDPCFYRGGDDIDDEYYVHLPNLGG